MIKDNFFNGPYYFFQGMHLVFAPNIKRYLFVPIVVNIILMSAIVIGIAIYLNRHLSGFLSSYSTWVVILLGGLVWILYITVSWLIGTIIFTMLTNIIACPFYGLLAESVEQKHEGRIDRSNPLNFWQMAYHTFLRELRKLVYFVPWLLACLLLLPFPLLWPLFPFVWWGVMSWIMAVQYCDYCADNKQISFKKFMQTMHLYPFTTLGFGAAVSLGLTIPIFNLIAPAAAVAGGTTLFLRIQSGNSGNLDNAVKRPKTLTHNNSSH